MKVKMSIATIALMLLFVPVSRAQAELEVLDFQGEVSFVDVHRSQIKVIGTDGEEFVYDVTEETEITYRDPETDETEELALSDIDVGETVHIKYSISDEANWASVIEVQPTSPVQ